MRPILLSVLLAVLAFPAATAAAAPGDPEPAAPAGGNVYRNDRYGVAVAGPSGWTREFEGPRGSGRWIDLVAFRDPRTRAYLCVSCQISTYDGFEEMASKLGEHYRAMKGLFILRGPERRAGVMGLRGPGLFLEFQQTSGDRTDRCFLVFWMNGRYLVRAYGSVRDKQFKKVEGEFARFPETVRLLEGSTVEKPNFEHEEARFGLVFPEDFRVRLPARGPVVAFEDDHLGVAVWVYRTPFDGDLTAYREHRVRSLRDEGATITRAPMPAPDPTRGEPALELDYTTGTGDAERRYREICLRHEDAVYRLVLGGSEASFARGVPVLRKMIDTLRFR